MALIRNWQDVADRGGADWLMPAERALIDACKDGGVCTLGDGQRPSDATPDRHIRAEVLRYLVLGGCRKCQVHGRGIRLSGAFVTGTLNLSYETAKGATALTNCVFEAPVDAHQSALVSLRLNGSALPGLNLQGADVKGDVFLRSVISDGTIALPGATIGGQLDCDGATFSVPSGKALNAQGLRVGDGLFWRGVKVQAGRVDLTTAHIESLNDDIDAWPRGADLRLNGLTYQRIFGSLDVMARLRWLANGSSNSAGEFAPQPYTHLATLYRNLGRDRDARKVLCERERKEHADLRRRLLSAPGGSGKTGALWIWRRIWMPMRLLWDWMLRFVVGYGFQPHRALYWLLALWLTATALAHMTWTTGDFAPNAPVVQISDGWQDLAVTVRNPAEAWSARTAQGRDWETFNAFAYGADLVVPIIDLNQTDAWTPSTNRGPWGQRLWRYSFLLNIAGWLITALGAAALTGIIQRGRE